MKIATSKDFHNFLKTSFDIIKKLVPVVEKLVQKGFAKLNNFLNDDKAMKSFKDTLIDIKDAMVAISKAVLFAVEHWKALLAVFVAIKGIGLASDIVSITGKVKGLGTASLLVGAALAGWSIGQLLNELEFVQKWQDGFARDLVNIGKLFGIVEKNPNQFTRPSNFVPQSTNPSVSSPGSISNANRLGMSADGKAILSSIRGLQEQISNQPSQTGVNKY